MATKKQEIDELKTEIIGLEVRIRRIEDYLCSIPSAEEYIIYETGAEDELLEEAKKVVLNYDFCSASLLQRELEVGYARASRILDELERAGIVGKGEGGKPRKVLISKNNKKKSKK